MKMKAKYVLGQMVKTDEEAGEIVGILYKEESVSYQVDLRPGGVRFVEENEILQSYDPSAKKRTRKKKQSHDGESK